MSKTYVMADGVELTEAQIAERLSGPESRNFAAWSATYVSSLIGILGYGDLNEATKKIARDLFRDYLISMCANIGIKFNKVSKSDVEKVVLRMCQHERTRIAFKALILLSYTADGKLIPKNQVN